ncbi:MAG: His-Xaa-Ser system radical SAM maturase HxsB [Alistipes ihumii]|jgi:paired radical SAM protein 1|uniref:His-Xaa-Ser system radical SAM maturase HxsB n=2 Tax=Alistipes ihumii TaxID=1470347 RepID=UPI0027BA5374|nr:His-Xaa-Ser system radical SAM maturase HxsB [Alistipes ihumii]
MMGYFLLPFRFHIVRNRELLVNDLGDYLSLPRGSVQRIVDRQIRPDEELYKDLIASFFISERPLPRLLDSMAVRLATRKAFLDHFTALHIFVLTLRCNQNCIYCQASSKECHHEGYDMSEESLRQAIDLMFRSPSPSLTMEFQGGEPTLMPHLIRKGIKYAEEKNRTEQRRITYVICTNCVAPTDEILDLCKRYGAVISTSLDGPQFLHNRNRGKTDSYQKVVSGIAKVRQELGADRISALMTTSEYSLDYPREIIDAYRENGFHSIFIRALNPYGLAKENDDWTAYCDRFVAFYKQALEYILEINKSGETFIEEFATLILRKILTPFPIGFVDLQSPSGIVNGVAVYNYDGYVYASDESRMLAEYDDYTFRLGRVSDCYENLFYGRRVQEISRLWATEHIAGCADCAFQSICGADPVRNYSTQGDMYGFRPTSNFCRKHKAIIEYIFELLTERREEVLPIFKSWITGTRG